MKKIFFVITVFGAALMVSTGSNAQNSKNSEPAVDTKGAEALKKQPTNKNDIPNSKLAVPGKLKQEANEQKPVIKEEEEKLKGIKVEPPVAPVAVDRPRGSTIDDKKQPPARTPVQPMVPKEAQKVDN